MDVTQIISCVFALLMAVITVFVIPYIKEQFTQAQRQRIKDCIETAVMAAEKLFPTIDGKKLGKDKLQYVADYLENKGVVFDVDDIYDDIRIMIESAVKEFCN